MKAPRIVAFTKDWDDVPTSTTHVLKEMGRTCRVLWINSIGTRKVRVGSGKDVSRMLTRLKTGFRRAGKKTDGINVLSPILIPGARSVFGQSLNRILLSWLVRRELRNMGDSPVEYWCVVPNAVDFLPRADKQDEKHLDQKIIYYCVDDWGKFKHLDRQWIRAKEMEMMERADIIFAVSRYLEDKCRSVAGEKIYYMPHGVEYDKFSSALSDDVEVPPDISSLRKPVIGFYGNIYPWIDFDLLKFLAISRPEWSFVIIGEIFCDVSVLRKIGNIHFLGRREHNELSAYCAGFNAGIIPYDMRNSRMESVHPVKTRELLAAGVPVAACNLPELRKNKGNRADRRVYGDDEHPESEWGDAIILCKTREEWLAALDRQIARKDRNEISKKVVADDWAGRVMAIRAIVDSYTEGEF